MVLIPVAVLAAACGKKSPAVDDALKNDLALASQAQASQPISPNEAGYAPQTASQTQAARQSTYNAPVRHTSSARRSSGVYRSGSGGGYYPSSPPTTIERHTGRDAAIGAAAGAVLGATTSRNKVQGGLIGAAIGGVLGGVVGHSVDVTKRTGW
jgi:hypothetical protein